ncbi:MAG: hypothetical protein MUE36_04490 [Acidimicrobiales bacterium]|nr:hypothetical protein [Acidimicrobiales bacterium]
MANHKKTAKPRKPRAPLPKVGTPADDHYRLEHSRHDVVDFGRTRRGGVMWFVGLAVVAVLVLGVVGLALFT